MDIPRRTRATVAVPLLALACASLFALAIAPANAGAATAAQDAPPDFPTLADPDEAPIQVMILGVFHFHNPGADYVQFEGLDILSDRRQREIEAVAADLAGGFHPTKVAVEMTAEEAATLDADYAAYLAGDFELTASEVHQLGFRIAERMGLEGLEPVDHMMASGIDTVIAYLQENDPDRLAAFSEYFGEVAAVMDEMQASRTIGATLRFMNDPDQVRRAHEPYAVQATLGRRDDHIGARMLALWYERNMRIFSNLAGVASPGDRVLLIIGAGHAPILRHLVETHPGMELVEAVDYLP